MPYLKPHSKILCPFDTEESEFVKLLQKEGHDVQFSHIRNGKDFFSLEKPKVDYVISNPPFSKRDAILKRLYEWDIPFAMIFNVNGLFDSRNRSILADRGGCEVLYMYPRVKFIDEYGNKNSPPFQSCYWCRNILPERIVFKFIDKNEQIKLF